MQIYIEICLEVSFTRHNTNEALDYYALETLYSSNQLMRARVKDRERERKSGKVSASRMLVRSLTLKNDSSNNMALVSC